MAALESAVKASSLPESICGRDERVRVDPATSPCYKWIGFLLIEAANGKRYLASGFKIHLPDVSHTAVVTSGHCVYIAGAYARSITVTFPGQAAVRVTSQNLYASPEYISNGSADHDYGLILLPGNSDEGFGWSTELTDDELKKRIVTNCGYPGDKPQGTMWITGGEIARTTSLRIFYMNDTIGGQSGSPVYTWYKGYWTVIGVHSYGGCPNSAPRFTLQMISRFMRRLNSAKAIKSGEFPDVYVSCNGTSLDKPLPSGGGEVKPHYKVTSNNEKFYIYPRMMTPSLAPPTTPRKVVIESASKEGVYFRMDGSSMTAFNGNGGGVVNCQFGAGANEEFFLKAEARNGVFSIVSVAKNQIRLRLDGSATSSSNPVGSVGWINCQYYDSISSPAIGHEKIQIVDA